MLDLPPAILGHIHKLGLERRRPAWLLVDGDGHVAALGGDLAAYGLAETDTGRPIADCLDVMEGMLPLDGMAVEIPCVRMGGGRYTDVHLLGAADGDCVLLLDATEQAQQRQVLQQRGNELSLLRDRLAQQNEALKIKDRVIASSVNPIATADLEGHLTYVNAAFLQLWGYESSEEILGKPAGEFWHGGAETSGVTGALLGGGRWIGRVRGWGRGGAPLDLQLSASPVTDPQGGPLCAAYSFVDITELSQLRRRLKRQHSLPGIVGRDAEMLKLFDTIREVADVDVPVLIFGESGTGKELVAAAIHNEGPRAGKPFVAVNCGALPEGVLESELFGHVRGAFTGAVRDRKGRFELAHTGTILLDEVGDLPPAVQVKLLRVLQDGTFQRVGGEETHRVDVRVISATNKDLRKEIAAGRFREDLFYRLSVVPVSLPPLRQRKNDIPLLAGHILEKVLADSGREGVELSQDAVEALLDYDWPGNVRELENALQFALVKCRTRLVERDHLPATVFQSRPPGGRPRRRRKRKLSADAVRSALEQTGGSKVEAARLLNVSRATLYRFLGGEA